MVATIKFAKCRDNAIIPTKRVEDAGLDLYMTEDEILLAPHETKLIPTGICWASDSDWVMVIKERSSWGSKGIGVRAGIVDSGYRGEIKVALTNHTNFSVHIPKEKAIAQALILPVPILDIEELTYDELQEIPSLRGQGGFGSTDCFMR